MIAVISLLLVIGFSLLITRVAAVALELTGLSADASRFQARSAFTGAGFTTNEAEQVVNHPLRRRIIAWLMFIGNAGTISAMAALLLSVIDIRTQAGAGALVAVLLIGILILCALSSSDWVDRRFSGVVRWGLQRYTELEVADYARLLHVNEAFAVSQLRIGDTHWLAGRTIASAGLMAEGLLILGVECPLGNFVGTPSGDIEILTGDTLILYGPAERVSELSSRCRDSIGDQIHDRAVVDRRRDFSEERMNASR